jgi:hypothetical protein
MHVKLTSIHNVCLGVIHEDYKTVDILHEMMKSSWHRRDAQRCLPHTHVSYSLQQGHHQHINNQLVIRMECNFKPSSATFKNQFTLRQVRPDCQ